MRFLFGDSKRRSVWTTDSMDEAGSTMVWESKAFSFGAPEWAKLIRRIILQVLAEGADGALSLSFRADLGGESPTIPIVVPSDGIVHTITVYPSQVGVTTFHHLSMIIRQGLTGARPQIHSIAFEYKPLGVRPR